MENKNVCPQCSNGDIAEDANFCKNCGLDLSKAAAGTTAQKHTDQLTSDLLNAGVLKAPDDNVKARFW